MKLVLSKLVTRILEIFEKKGFEIYIVGGAVRDLLTRKKVYDWDFTTNAKPDEIQKIIPESFYDNRFGTVGITAEDLAKQFKIKISTLTKNNINSDDVFEITTFRTEGKYTDKRRPDKVRWGKTLEEDLKRRDFTINAMALKITDYGLRITDYELIDLFGGQEDLKNKLIRAVGDPNKRFSEDALRLMRAIRIAAELGFTIEEKTLKTIFKNAALLQKISEERIRDEFLKILKSDFPADGVKMLISSGLLKYIMPEFLKTQEVQQAGHHTKDVFEHSLDSLQNCPSKDPIIRLATLLHDIGKPYVSHLKEGKVTFYNHEVVGGRMVKKIAERLRFSKKDKEKLWLLVRHHMFAYDPKMTDKAIRRFIRRVGKENINDMMMLRIGDRLGGGSKATSWRLRELQTRIGKLFYTPMQVTDLKVNGNNIMKILKIKSGPKVGEVLNQLFEEVLEDASKNKREYLLKRIKDLK